MNRENKAYKPRLFLAAQMLQVGRPIAFVKKISGLTLNEMVLQGLIYEMRIPDPDGYKITGVDKDGQTIKTHNGIMISTGRYLPTPGVPKQEKIPSNKSQKRKNRVAFFTLLREERWRRWQLIMNGGKYAAGSAS